MGVRSVCGIGERGEVGEVSVYVYGEGAGLWIGWEG